MITVEAGQMFDASICKSGESSKGKWFMIPVNAEKGNDSIIVFADNPDEVSFVAKYQQVVSISKVIKTAKKDDNGKWHDRYTVNATITSITGIDEPSNPFEDSDPFATESDLPF